jgi:hypothetical protein
MSEVLELTFVGLFVLLNKGALPANDGYVKGAAAVIAVDTSSKPCGIMQHKVTLLIPSKSVTSTCPTTDGDYCVWDISKHKIAFGDPTAPHVDMSDPNLTRIGHMGGHTAGNGVDVGATGDSSPLVGARFDLFEGAVKSAGNYQTADGTPLPFTFRTKVGIHPLLPNPRPLSRGIIFETTLRNVLEFLPMTLSGSKIVIELKQQRKASLEVRNDPVSLMPTPRSKDVEVSHFRAYYAFCKKMPPCDEIPVPHFDGNAVLRTNMVTTGSPTCPPDQLP